MSRKRVETLSGRGLLSSKSGSTKVSYSIEVYQHYVSGEPGGYTGMGKLTVLQVSPTTDQLLLDTLEDDESKLSLSDGRVAEILVSDLPRGQLAKIRGCRFRVNRIDE